MDLLQRDEAPLSARQWQALDAAVIETARSMLIGRRIMALVGPFGLGVEALPSDRPSGASRGQIDLLGEAPGEAVGIAERRFIPLPMLYKDFWLLGRDLEASQRFGLPLDTSRAAAAAAATASTEDHLVLEGNAELGISGLRTTAGRTLRPLNDWAQAGQGFSDVVEGVHLLTSAGFPGPFALLVSPLLFAQLHRIFGSSGVLEIEQVSKLARRGVYPTSILPEPSAILVDSGPQNMDLALAADFKTAFIESTNLNYRFRVLESIAPRIRRPEAICVFEPAS